MRTKIFLTVKIAAILFAVMTFSSGCMEDTQASCAVEVDNLLDTQDSGWVYSSGFVTYPLSNGVIRIRFNGSIDMVVQHETGPSIIPICNYNGTRAAKIAKKFGISKMTPEELNVAGDVKESLLQVAISEITNIVAKSNPTIYEEEE